MELRCGEYPHGITAPSVQRRISNPSGHCLVPVEVVDLFEKECSELVVVG